MNEIWDFAQLICLVFFFFSLYLSLIVFILDLDSLLLGFFFDQNKTSRVLHDIALCERNLRTTFVYLEETKKKNLNNSFSFFCSLWSDEEGNGCINNGRANEERTSEEKE